MFWMIIIGLLIIGLILLVVEVVFIPGTTVVGVLGVIFTLTGVMLSFDHYGREVGFYVLSITLVGTAVALYFSFKSDAWAAFALKSTIDSKVNEGQLKDLVIGDEGTAISALRPSGKAEFRDQVFEVRTTGSFVDPGTKIKIILIESHRIIVEIIN